MQVEPTASSAPEQLVQVLESSQVKQLESIVAHAFLVSKNSLLNPYIHK